MTHKMIKTIEQLFLEGINRAVERMLKEKVKNKETLYISDKGVIRKVEASKIRTINKKKSKLKIV